MFGPPCRRARWAEVGAAGESRRAQHVVGDISCLGAVPRRAAGASALRTHRAPKRIDARTATPGQSGLPAEFKHINKRRRRNLQGFP